MQPDVLRVLVVEDDPMISMAVEATVEDEGHCLVGVASCSRSAIGLADAESPDLVLLDYHLLDGPTGLDVASTSDSPASRSCSRPRTRVASPSSRTPWGSW